MIAHVTGTLDSLEAILSSVMPFTVMGHIADLLTIVSISIMTGRWAWILITTRRERSANCAVNVVS